MTPTGGRRCLTEQLSTRVASTLAVRFLREDVPLAGGRGSRCASALDDTSGRLTEPMAGGLNPAMQVPMLVFEKQADIAELCRRTGARQLDLFGSAVREDFDPVYSDLDFVVVFKDLAPVAYAESFFSQK